MVESGAFAKAKGLLLQWMRWAYLRRESVALLCFGAGQVRWLLQPTRASRWNGDLIEPLLGGGGTPLAAALQAGWDMAAKQSKQPSCLWVISDFRSPDVLTLEQSAPHCLSSNLKPIWIDCEAMTPSIKNPFRGSERLCQVWPDSIRVQI